MKISSLLLSIFIFVGLSAGLYTYYSDFITPYSNAGLTASPTASILSSYTSTSLNALNDDITYISSVIENVNGNINFGAVIIGMGILFLDVIKTIITMPMLIISILTDLMGIGGILEPIPFWFKDMIGVIITTYIVFRLASTVLGGRDL